VYPELRRLLVALEFCHTHGQQRKNGLIKPKTGAETSDGTYNRVFLSLSHRFSKTFTLHNTRERRWCLTMVVHFCRLTISIICGMPVCTYEKHMIIHRKIYWYRRTHLLNFLIIIQRHHYMFECNRYFI